MKELIIHGVIVRVFNNSLVKIYAKSQNEADNIWDYLIEEKLIEEQS